MSNIKITDADKKYIRDKYAEGVSIKDLSLYFKVHPSTIIRHLDINTKHKVANKNIINDETHRRINTLIAKYEVSEEFKAELLNNFYLEFLEEENKYFPIIELEAITDET